MLSIGSSIISASFFSVNLADSLSSSEAINRSIQFYSLKTGSDRSLVSAWSGLFLSRHLFILAAKQIAPNAIKTVMVMAYDIGASAMP